MEKPVFLSTGNPVMKTSFSLCGNTTQGNPCSGPVLALYGIAVNLKVLGSDLIFRPPSILHKTGLLEKPMGINTLESHAPASYKKFFRLRRTAASLLILFLVFVTQCMIYNFDLTSFGLMQSDIEFSKIS